MKLSIFAIIIAFSLTVLFFSAVTVGGIAYLSYASYMEACADGVCDPMDPVFESSPQNTQMLVEFKNGTNKEVQETYGALNVIKLNEQKME